MRDGQEQGEDERGGSQGGGLLAALVQTADAEDGACLTTTSRRRIEFEMEARVLLWWEKGKSERVESKPPNQETSQPVSGTWSST